MTDLRNTLVVYTLAPAQPWVRVYHPERGAVTPAEANFIAADMARQVAWEVNRRSWTCTRGSAHRGGPSPSDRLPPGEGRAGGQYKIGSDSMSSQSSCSGKYWRRAWQPSQMRC